VAHDFEFCKSKRLHFGKKQKSTGLQLGFDRVNRVAGSTRRISRVTPGFSFPCFFFNPANSYVLKKEKEKSGHIHSKRKEK
jgi:hypothetical protein